MVEQRKSLRKPDETIEFNRVKTELVELGDVTVGRIALQPGWRWSNDVRPRPRSDSAMRRGAISCRRTTKPLATRSTTTAAVRSRPPATASSRRSTGNALHCALALRERAARQDLHIRAGVHVGEVELVGPDVRGVAVHEAARIMGKAGADEILVSETTRALALPSDFAFEDRGTHELKGLPGEWRLYAYVPAPGTPPSA